MRAELQFTKRFHKESRSREFDAALVHIRDKIIEILEHGPAFDKQFVKPLSHTTKRNFWRIRANIQPSPYRLFFEWVSNKNQPILRLVTFVPKKARICKTSRTSEMDKYSTVAVTGSNHESLQNKILNTHEITESKISKPTSNEEWLEKERQLAPNVSPLPEEERPDQRQAKDQVPNVVLEPIEKDDLIEIYATSELIYQFANLQEWPRDIIKSLQKCTTTDEAAELISKTCPSAEEQFIQFLLDEDSPSDLERLYKVSNNCIDSIAKRPLASFMLNIDPEQQSAIDRPINDKPFMVRGAAGSGKSVVCLYRMRRMLIERSHESLFSADEKPRYIFISYTNALVKSAEALFKQITQDLNLSDVDIEFSTLDLELANIAKRLRALGVSIPHIDNKIISTAYWTAVKSDHIPAKSAELLREIGLNFFTKEVDEVLIDKNVKSLNEYLEKGIKKRLRKGLVIPLNEKYRTAIWYAYEILKEHSQKHNKVSWSMYRQRLLIAFDTHPEAFPHYSGLIADEIQDFGNIQMKLIVKLSRSRASILFASDIGQTIYRRQASMSSIDRTLNFNRSNSVILKRSYRMTKEITKALAPLRLEMSKLHQAKYNASIPVFSGPKPKWIKAHCDNHQNVVVYEIKKMLAAAEFNLGQFAVIFATNKSAEKFHEYAKTLGLTCQLHTKVKKVDPNLEAVHIITAHSSKGLEFPHVFVPFAAQLSNTNTQQSDAKNRFDHSEYQDAKNKLLYVACSRAGESLTIVQESNCTPSSLDLLNTQDWELVKLSKTYISSTS